MADLDRIKRNVAKMAQMNAPESDIDGYIASEGVTLEQVRSHKIGSQISQPTKQPVQQKPVVQPVKQPTIVKPQPTEEQKQAEIARIKAEYKARNKEIDRQHRQALGRIGLGATMQGLSALPINKIPFVGSALGGALFDAGGAIIEGASSAEIADRAKRGALAGATVEGAIRAIPIVGKPLAQSKVGRTVIDKSNEALKPLLESNVAKNIGNVLTKEITVGKPKPQVAKPQPQITKEVKAEVVEQPIQQIDDVTEETVPIQQVDEVVEQPIKQVEEVVENVPQQTEQPKVNLNTLKSNIRANKFEDKKIETIKHRYKNAYYTTIADPVNADFIKSEREFNNIITEISKNPEKLNDSVYMADLENRVQQIVDKTPYGNEAEVATPYWEKFWKAVDEGYNYNEFKANRGKKAPQQVDDIIPEQVVEATGNTKERGFVKTLRENFGEDTAKQVKDDKYIPTSHLEDKTTWESLTPEQQATMLNNADDTSRIATYGKAQAVRQAIENGEPLNVAMLDGVAKGGTKLGQEIEAYKHFIPNTPEGIALATTEQIRKNLPKQVLKLKDETSQIVDEINKNADMTNEEANKKFEVWLNTQIEKVKQKPAYGEKLDMLKAMENYRVQKANRALKASEKRMAREEFLNTDYSNEEAEARFLHSLSKDKRPPKAKSTRGTKEDLLKGMERYRQKEIKRLEREERQAISKLKKQELAKQKALEKEELNAIKALKREEEKRLKAIDNILAKRVVKPAERKSFATQLLALNDNNGLTPENFARLVDKHYGIQTIDVSDYAKIQELSNRFINATTDRERDVANGLIKKFIWNKQPKKWADKTRTYRNINMLLSVPSRLLDVTSTAVFQGVRALDELTAKGLDKIARTGVRGGIENMSPKDWFKSVARGAKEGAEDVNLGINTARSGEVDRYELGFHPQFENVPLLGKAEKALNATIRVPDRMFYEAKFDSALKDLMSTGKFTAEEAEEIARNEALQAVFQGQGLLSRTSKDVRDWFDNLAPDLRIGSHIAPFVQTPANLVAEGLERSPLGLTKGIVQWKRATTPQELRAAQETVAKGLTGSIGAVGLGGYALNKLPNNIGGLTNEDLYGDEVRNLPPQSVVIGDKSISLAGAPYFTIPAGMGKALLAPDKSLAEKTLNSIAYTGNILSDLPMYKGLGDLYKGVGNVFKEANEYATGKDNAQGVVDEVGRLVGQQGANALSQYIPLGGTLGTIRNAADPFNRELMTYNENPLLGTAEYIGNRLQNRIPFASSLLPVKYNVLGEPSMRNNIENDWARWSEALLSPVRIRNYTERPAEMEEMQRIQDYAMENDITGKTTLKFAKPKRYIGRGKDKTRLTNEQYSELTRLYNGKVYDELQFLMNTPEYQSADEKTQIKWVREVMKEKKQEAEQEISDIIK